MFADRDSAVASLTTGRSSMPDPVVFVVDDDAAVRDSLKFVLSAADYRVETFASGEEFLERWRHDRAGCLLADMNLPDMSGANLAGMLKGRVANLSIILMTGKGGRRSRAMADRLGAFYIEKPFIHDCLLATVRGAMASHADGSASATTHDG